MADHRAHRTVVASSSGTLRGAISGPWLAGSTPVPGPTTPVSAEPNPEHSICRSEKRSGASSLKHGELMTEDGVLSRQRDAGSSHATGGSEGPEETMRS